MTWKFRGFNAAFNAYEVYFDDPKTHDFGKYFIQRAIEVPVRYFYAKGKDASALDEACRKAKKWLEKINA